MKSKLIQFALSLAFIAGFVSCSAVPSDESQSSLKAQAKVTQEEATRTALAKVKNGRIKATELEKENGILVWSFDISMPKTMNIREIQVDAKTGKILSNKIETLADQAKEAAADKKEKK